MDIKVSDNGLGAVEISISAHKREMANVMANVMAVMTGLEARFAADMTAPAVVVKTSSPGLADLPTGGARIGQQTDR